MEEKQDDDDDKVKQGSEAQVADRAGQTDGHGHKDQQDVFSPVLHGAEAHEAEGSGNRQSGTDVAVDHHDDGLDDGGHQHKRERI